MATITFTPHLARHVPLRTWHVPANSVAQALAGVFLEEPRLESYVLDDRGAVRHHVAVFVDGGALVDRKGLSDRVGQDASIHVMQALSGG